MKYAIMFAAGKAVLELQLLVYSIIASIFYPIFYWVNISL